ncbi:MAG: AraC family transcriptional regulator [Bacilli bacterium]|nr:AraC family transcriptional regulator [Bacilli bacterium]
MIIYKYGEEYERDFNGLSYHYLTGNYPLLHSHNYWEFIVCTNGSYKHVVNGKEEKLDTGFAALLKPGDVHILEADTPESTHLNILISDEQFKNKCSTFSDTMYQLFLDNCPISVNLSFNRLSKIQKFLKELLINNDEVKNKQEASFVIFNIIELSYEYIVDVKETLMPNWFKEIIIQCNSINNLNWKPRDATNYIHYSQAHVNRYFKKIYGITLVDYLTKIKMNHAVHLLINSDKSLNEICTILGYNSISYFSHTFKERYKISPHQYRLSFMNKNIN